MARYRSTGGIPDRWLDYSAVGQRLSGTRFIAFKVPLKEALSQNHSTPEHRFGFSELLEMMTEQKQQLGLIIDLTNTFRYYSPQDFPDSLSWVKMKTAGHEIPSDPVILNFKRVVRRFIRENQDNDLLIGVHCTHGLNRTGYLICRYLIDVDHMDPEEALKLFGSSRGHSIERQNYLKDLREGPLRSNHGMEEEGEDQLEPRNGTRTEESLRDRLPALVPPEPAHHPQQPQRRAMPREPLPQYHQHQHQYPQYVYQDPQNHNHYPPYVQQHHQHQKQHQYPQYVQHQQHQNEYYYPQHEYQRPPSWSRMDRRSRHERGFSERRESDRDGGRHRRDFNPV